MISLSRATQEAAEARAVLRKARAALKAVKAEQKAIRRAERKLAKEMKIARKLEKREAYHEKRSEKKVMQQMADKIDVLLTVVEGDTKKANVQNESPELSRRLDNIEESQKRIERTLSQMTLGNVQSSPVRTLVENTSPGITKPKPKPSPLVMEVKSHPIFLKRAKESKEWI